MPIRLSLQPALAALLLAVAVSPALAQQTTTPAPAQQTPATKPDPAQSAHRTVTADPTRPIPTQTAMRFVNPPTKAASKHTTGLPIGSGTASPQANGQNSPSVP